MTQFDIPPYTCGSIDSAISELEELRKDNEALRSAAVGYKEEYEEANSTIEELEQEVYELKYELEDVTEELAKLEGE